jgi:nitrite reductase/ring-hydroxylating ferredoxin subunit
MSYQRVAKLADLPDRGMIACQVAGLPIVLCRLDRDVIALSNECTHEGDRLSDGELDISRREIECPRHFGTFSIDTGDPVAPPPVLPIQRFPVRVYDGNVEIYLAD